MQVFVAKSVGTAHMPHVSLLILTIYFQEPSFPPQINQKSLSSTTLAVFLFIHTNSTKESSDSCHLPSGGCTDYSHSPSLTAALCSELEFLG